MKPLSRPSRWLLLHMDELFPLAVATTTALPCHDYRDQPTMVNLRGLIRRGWAKEWTEDNTPTGRGTGLYCITEEGRKAAAALKHT